MKKILFWLYLCVLGLGTVVMFTMKFQDFMQIRLTHDEFHQYLERDKIKSITIVRHPLREINKNIAYIETYHSEQATMVVHSLDVFLDTIDRVQIEHDIPAQDHIQVQLLQADDSIFDFKRIFYIGYLLLLISFVTIEYFFGANIMKEGFTIFEPALKTKPTTKFQDVAGLDEAKVEIAEFVDFLKNPEKFKKMGAKIPRGALLCGPPGTGKTLLAKAVAGEADVPFFSVSGSEFVEVYVGLGAQKVRNLFKKARKQAPSIIFIDEIDAVGKKRSSNPNGNEERDQTLNQLLVEMDGFATDSNVIVFAATNRKELLDPALTRPGRLDRQIDISLPDIEGRKQIFMVHLKPLKLHADKSIDEYANRLACLTPGYSGADIANLCNESAILAARTGQPSVRSEEFESAADRIIAGMEQKRVTPIEEKRTVAVHESGHAVVAWFLEGGMPLLKVTIVARSKGALGFAQYLPNEGSLETKEELMDRICSVLGGRCAEELFFGKVTTGAYDDLRKAYDIAYAMITKFGMSDEIGFIGFSEGEYVKKHSDLTCKNIDDAVKQIIDECTKKTRTMCQKYRDYIERMSAALLEKETMDLQAVIAVLGERPYAPRSNFKAYLEAQKSAPTASKSGEKKMVLEDLSSIETPGGKKDAIPEIEAGAKAV
jgi:AFG3 family protein